MSRQALAGRAGPDDSYLANPEAVDFAEPGSGL